MSSISVRDIPKAWILFDLPGIRVGESRTMYKRFDYDSLPPKPHAVDESLQWLRDLAQSGSPDLSIRPDWASIDLGELPIYARPPRSVVTFLADEHLQRNVPSAETYLDLGEGGIPVLGGGSLLHVLSDQQFIQHWFVFQDLTGETCVVSSCEHLGFVTIPDVEVERPLDMAQHDIVCVAPTFSEFIWRFSIELNVVSARGYSPRTLSECEQTYVDHSSRARTSRR